MSAVNSAQTTRSGRGLAALAVVLAVCLISCSNAQAYTYKVLHNFYFDSGDGFMPQNTVVMDKSGNLYGTTEFGGSGACKNKSATKGCGTVFELSFNTATHQWDTTLLYNFGRGPLYVPPSGQRLPFAGVIVDGNGNLFGTTLYGGNQTVGGSVYQLSPGATPGGWTQTMLYAFPSTASYPQGGLINDGKGNLYGTTEAGGTIRGGTVFELGAPSQAGQPWIEKTLYNFCGAKHCGDGRTPTTGMIIDGLGNLYGTTFGGGKGCGTVFELSPVAGHFTYHQLYSFFCASSDGSKPFSKLAKDRLGNLYGTTIQGGGDSVNCPDGCGTVFKLSPPNKVQKTWTEKVIYKFLTTNRLDGFTPEGSLAIDASDIIYGTTVNGGTHGVGIVFQLIPNAAMTKWTENVLHDFCDEGSSCPNGMYPAGGVILDKAGNLYGTTTGSINSFVGSTVYELVK